MPSTDGAFASTNCKAALGKASPGNPVFLTKNGAEEYAIVDSVEYDFLNRMAFEKLFIQLDEYRMEAEKEGWTSETAVRERFGLKVDG